MWIFTKYGFYSAVCARGRDGEHGQLVDRDRMMIRARVKAHLEALERRFPELLGACDIRASSHTDYAFRIFVDKSVWSHVMTLLAEEIDYDNFKSEVERHQGRNAYERALHDIWSVMYGLQKSPGRA